jgi:hypothetical protein
MVREIRDDHLAACGCVQEGKSPTPSMREDRGDGDHLQLVNHRSDFWLSITV